MLPHSTYFTNRTPIMPHSLELQNPKTFNNVVYSSSSENLIVLANATNVCCTCSTKKAKVLSLKALFHWQGG